MGSFNKTHVIEVTPTKTTSKGEVVENVFQTSYGALRVKDLIGTRFGSKVQMTKGYGYALHPTPELWTKNLPHRTQIIYATDISLILLQLELKPGSIVIESGTGSGSLSHSILRTIAPNGHLHTFDFHQQRVDLAQEEFKNHGWVDQVTVKQRDVCQNGFDLNDVADAVFLDLPHPWDAIPYAKLALKSGGRLCSFSPCLEQVQKATIKMRELGFTEISTMECLLREYQPRKITLPVFDNDHESLEYGKGNGNEDPEPPESKKRKSENVKKTMETSFYTGVPLTTMPGHTGYLTFATLK